jgi:hypothetical protein
MSYSRNDPVLKPTPILDLRPTQMTVGYREVEIKRKAFAAMRAADKNKEIARHMVPVVLGPKGGRYVTDHHHMLCALHEDGETQVLVMVIGDLQKADPDHFWNLMDYHGWTHPFDDKGRRRDYAYLPKTVKHMLDDPYRSLAGELRSAGGFAKDSTPYSEFVWADFFRERIKRKLLKENFAAALIEALAIAKSKDADYLPGWCGPHQNGANSVSSGPAAATKPAAAKPGAAKTSKR